MSPVPKRPVEGSIVSTFGLMVCTDQDGLADIPDDLAEQLHLYMICQRPRIAVVPEEFDAKDDRCRVVFTAQRGEQRRRIALEVPNYLGRSDVEMRATWPHTDFEIVASDGEQLIAGRSSLFLTTLGYHDDDLDLKVMYVGQAYGSSGERSAARRLAKHETLQGIYGEAIRRSPDQEVFLVLLALDDPYGLIVLAPVPGDKDEIADRFIELMTPISEQQRINFTETALIKYFSPTYNQDYKNTFPSPAHKTYTECYDVDLNLVAFELETSQGLRTRLFSDTVPPSWLHAAEFPLHNASERRHMFDFGPD